MPKKYETCTIQGQVIQSGGFFGNNKAALVVLSGDQNREIYRSELFKLDFDDRSKEITQERDSIINQLTVKGWDLVTRDIPGIYDIFVGKVPILLRREVGSDEICSPSQALAVLHQKSLVTDEEFLEISKRIRDL